MSQDLLDYSKLMENAVRTVVREALSITAEFGVPGLHHFYITFLTGADGVSIPDHLSAAHPDEMTIVLENQFWDLEVSEAHFAISLGFSGVRERLVVPFDAVTSFVDPSVKFGLQFGAQGADAEAAGADAPAAPGGDGGDTGDTDSAHGGDGDRVVTLDSFRRK
jgi:hypothetical protein